MPGRGDKHGTLKLWPRPGTPAGWVLFTSPSASQRATPEQLAAIEGAIQTWNDVLLKCFDGLITLTQVDSRQDADIVVQYVPTTGGVVWRAPT